MRADDAAVYFVAALDAAVTLYATVLKLRPGSPSRALWTPAFSVAHVVACSIVIGLLSIDASFDLPLLLTGNSPDTLTIAWGYYRTMLNNVAVNVTAGSCAYVIVLHPLFTGMDLGWRYIRGVAGTIVYVGVIGLAYVHIINAEKFDAAIFDEWQAVFVSRIFMVACGLWNVVDTVNLASTWVLLQPPQSEVVKNGKAQ